MEGEVPALDLWFGLSAGVLCLASAWGAAAVFPVPGVGGPAAVLPRNTDLPEEAAQRKATILNRVTERKAPLLTGTLICLLGAPALSTSIYVKVFLLPHVSLDRPGRAA